MPSRSRSTSAADILNRLRERVAGGPGTLDAPVRRAAIDGDDVPAEAQTYVDKVRRHAYKVTDGDVHALRAAGWSDDQLFELTVATALGAALSRRAAAQTAMQG